MPLLAMKAARGGAGRAVGQVHAPERAVGRGEIDGLGRRRRADAEHGWHAADRADRAQLFHALHGECGDAGGRPEPAGRGLFEEGDAGRRGEAILEQAGQRAVAVRLVLRHQGGDRGRDIGVEVVGEVAVDRVGDVRRRGAGEGAGAVDRQQRQVRVG